MIIFHYLLGYQQLIQTALFRKAERVIHQPESSCWIVAVWGFSRVLLSKRRLTNNALKLR